MSLHRAETADWIAVPAAQRNAWQQVAARTHGIATPGNLVSLIGAALVGYGLWAVWQGDYGLGAVTIVLGRLADVLDGMVADHTQTKSPVGEGVDAATDKIELGITMAVLFAKGVLPLPVMSLMFLHAMYNSLLAAAASHVGTKLHPSSTGKLGAVFEWGSIGLYLLAPAVQYHATAQNACLAGAAASFAIFLILGTYSSDQYTRELRKASR